MSRSATFQMSELTKLARQIQQSDVPAKRKTKLSGGRFQQRPGPKVNGRVVFREKHGSRNAIRAIYANTIACQVLNPGIESHAVVLGRLGSAQNTLDAR